MESIVIRDIQEFDFVFGNASCIAFLIIVGSPVFIATLILLFVNFLLYRLYKSYIEFKENGIVVVKGIFRTTRKLVCYNEITNAKLDYGPFTKHRPILRLKYLSTAAPRSQKLSVSLRAYNLLAVMQLLEKNKVVVNTLSYDYWSK